MTLPTRYIVLPKPNTINNEQIKFQYKKNYKKVYVVYF